jgi:dTDP-4-amino-4,6-dideoxygalactose transaminase
VTTHLSTGKIVSALLPVHLYGQPADMDSLQEIADAYDLPVIEDACQAHGAEYFSRSRNKWCKAGSLSMAAAFSFYPGKNLGALGEGGAITTSTAALAEYCRMLREHGSIKKYYHPIEGYNGRLDALQAGFLSHKLPLLHDWNEGRRNCAKIYNKLLSSIPGIVTPFEPKWARGNYHLYIIQTARRDELQGALAEQGIGTGLHYPLPLHLQEAYRGLNLHEGDFPVAEAAALRIMSLPMYPTLKKEQQERVAEAIKKFVDTHANTEHSTAENRLVSVGELSTLPA